MIHPTNLSGSAPYLTGAPPLTAKWFRLLLGLGLLPFASAVAIAQPAPSAWQDAPSSDALLRWFNRADIGTTPWSFDDVNNVGWAQAARAAAQLCGVKGVGAGHFNGHQDVSKGIYGVQCSDSDVVWRDASAQEISSSGWSFTDVNQVSWAQANRAAERLCAAANQGFAGGHFNGHQLSGNYGLFCYRGGAKWFDATDAELAATGWGFATPKLDDVQWAQAMRAATGFCQGKGFEGGFMNGHQAPNKYGVVCQRPVNIAQSTSPQPEVASAGPVNITLSTTPQPEVASADGAANSPPAASEPIPAAVQAMKYRMSLQFTDDTCPLNDYRDGGTAEISPFSRGPGFSLPLYQFGSMFEGPVALQGRADMATAGGELVFNGSVPVNLILMPKVVPARFIGTLSPDGSQFNGRFFLSGTCEINGTIRGSRL